MKENENGNRKASAASHGRATYGAGSWKGGTVTHVTYPGPSLTIPGPAQRPGYTDPNATPHAGIRAGEIIGWRAWVVNEEYNLGSLTADCEWLPGATIVGDPTAFVNVHTGLMAGIYSIKDVDHALVIYLSMIQHGHFPYRRVKKRKTQAAELIAIAKDLLGVKVSLEIYNVIGVALGSIKMWGEVHEHELGWRAEFAKVNSIDYATDTGGSVVDFVFLRELQERYKL
jgi:hypothetical protein